MKRKLISVLTSVLLCFNVANIFAQIAPDLNNAHRFVFFTSAGNITNINRSNIIGDIGSNSGITTWNDNINGSLHLIVPDTPTVYCASSVTLVYLDLAARTPTFFPSGSLGSGQVLNGGVYKISGNATITGNLVLDARRFPNTVFIIQISGSLTTLPDAQIQLVNGAQPCNVFWQVDGSVTMGANTVFKGTSISNGGITINRGSYIEGRALSINGNISCDSIRAYIPTGCGYPPLYGPLTANLNEAGCFALFSSSGQLTNPASTTAIIGDVGCNGGGTDPGPLFPGITGFTHYLDSPTIKAANFLYAAYGYCNRDSLAADILLRFPGTFGKGLILTPHIYALDGPTILQDTLFVDAQNNGNGTFIIQVNGSLTVRPNAVVQLRNRAKGANIFWAVRGAVDIGANALFKGTVMNWAGGITVATGAKVEGRLLTINGPVTMGGTSAVLPPDGEGPCAIPIINKKPVANDDTVEVCQNGPSIIINVQANDHDTDMNVLTTGIVRGPAHGISSLTLNRIRYAVTAGYNGPDTIIYKVCDDGFRSKCDTAYVLINVHTLPFVNAGPAKTICLHDSVAIGDTPATGIRYSWSPAAGLTSDTLSQPIASPTVTTSYWLTDTDMVTGCFNRDTVLVTVNPLPAPWAGMDSTICLRDSAAIGDTLVDSGLAYRWIPADGLNSDTIAAPMASPTITTTYVVTDTIRATGCYNSDTVVVTIIPLPVANAGLDAPICIGDSLRIGSPDSPNVVYQWTPATGLSYDTVAMPMAIPTVTTAYILLDTNTITGCHNADTIIVTVNMLPVTNAGPDTMVCLTDSILIGASQVAGMAYIWSPATGLSSATVGRPLASPAANITYALKVTDVSTGCFATDTVFVKVNPLPPANAGGPKAICYGQSVVLGAPAVTGNSYKWAPPTNLSADYVAQPTAIPETTTTYTLTETNAHCSLSAPVLVTVNPLPAANVGADQSIPPKASIQIGAEAVSGSSYLWSPTNNISSPTEAMPTVTPAATTIYTLTETNDATGCKQTNTVRVEVSEKDGYNAFSPNGDGKNDTWKIPELKFFPENKVSVLNRWGSEVWRADNYDNSKVVFEGKNLAGEALPDGTYYYTISYGNVSKTGWVLIKR